MTDTSHRDRATDRQQLQARLADDAAIARLSPDQTLELAERCEELGLARAAADLCRRVLAQDADHQPALARLGDLLDELGDGTGAATCRLRLAELRGEPPAAAAGDGVPIDPDDRIPHATPEDLERFVELFAGREGVHARQWADHQRGTAGYAPVREPLTPTLVRAHIDGRLTLGSYLVRTDDTARHVVLDLDVRKDALEACAGDPARTSGVKTALRAEGRRLCGVLGQLGIPLLYVDSGRKGRHLWITFTGPVPAADALALGRELIRTAAPAHADLHLEVFPKQVMVARGGLGNLVKLPLGIHRVSGRRSAVLHADGEPHPLPLRALARLERLQPARLPALIEALAARPSRPTDIRDARAAAQQRPAAPPAPPPFTERDLQQDPEITALLEGCGVLRRVVDRVLAEGRIDYDMLVVLKHTLGHLEQGLRAVNFLLDHCKDVAADERMGRVQRGSPSSCANLRRRLSGIARKVGCECRFAPRRDRSSYANPLLHIDDRDEAVRVLAPPARRKPGDGEGR